MKESEMAFIDEKTPFVTIDPASFCPNIENIIRDDEDEIPIKFSRNHERFKTMHHNTE